MSDTSMSANVIRDRLIARGVSINRPANEAMLSKLNDTFSGKVDVAFINLYAAFNGFPEGELDSGSAINIWPIQKVVDQYISSKLSGSRAGFADFLIGSDELTCDFALASGAILYVESSEIVANSFQKFLENLVLGEYDF